MMIVAADRQIGRGLFPHALLKLAQHRQPIDRTGSGKTAGDISTEFVLLCL